MAELKTKKNDASVEDFLAQVNDPTKQADSRLVYQMMEAITGETGKMYGKSIVGFGNYDFRYASGKAGSWFVTGFSPRKQNLTLYIMPGFSQYDDLLGQLGKHKIGKSCLYMKKLADIDVDVLKQLIQASCDYMAQKYPPSE